MRGVRSPGPDLRADENHQSRAVGIVTDEDSGRRERDRALIDTRCPDLLT